MSLRLQVNLIISVLLGLMASLLVGLQIDNTRRSVRDEVDGANVVASQLLGRVNWVYGYGGLDGMREFLNGVGRVRANDIQLFDALGQQLYRSPPSPTSPDARPRAGTPGWCRPPWPREKLPCPAAASCCTPTPRGRCWTAGTTCCPCWAGCWPALHWPMPRCGP